MPHWHNSLKIHSTSQIYCSSIRHPNQTLVAFFHLPTSEWRLLWSRLGKFVKACYSLPVCLFLNLGILACSLFFHLSSPNLTQGRTQQQERLKSRSSEKQRDCLVCVIQPTCRRFSNSANSAKPHSTRTPCVRLQCKQPSAKCLNLRD